MFRIRLLSPFRTEYQHPPYFFSRSIPSETADALLCEWAPHEELLVFPGPKVWYNSEAASRQLFSDSPWGDLKANQERLTFISHTHPDAFYRVPMICFVDPLLRLNSDERQARVAAVISNWGNGWPRQFEMLTIRNAFAIHPLVDLYGKEENWRLFAQNRLGQFNLPPNFRGEIHGTWNSQLKYLTLARYKVALCLENESEPYYFTEKFHAAAQAGCIPIYHAHPTVRDSILVGARWVDPADFGFEVESTLRFALSQDRQLYASANFAWLETPQARLTGLDQVFARLGAILTKDISDRKERGEDALTA